MYIIIERNYNTIMSKEQTSRQFTLEEKRRLSNKISANRNKDELIRIKNIIFEDNPNIPINRDSGGMLMFFQNLNPQTYVKLEKFIKDIEHKKMIKQTNIITKTSDKMLSELSDQNYMTSRSRYRYSNKERNIMKRKEYADIMADELCGDVKKTDKVTKNGSFSKNEKSIFTKDDCHSDAGGFDDMLPCDKKTSNTNSTVNNKQNNASNTTSNTTSNTANNNVSKTQKGRKNQ